MEGSLDVFSIIVYLGTIQVSFALEEREIHSANKASDKPRQVPDMTI